MPILLGLKVCLPKLPDYKFLYKKENNDWVQIRDIISDPIPNGSGFGSLNRSSGRSGNKQGCESGPGRIKSEPDPDLEL